MCCKENLDLYIGKTNKHEVISNLFGWNELQTNMVMERLNNGQMIYVKTISSDMLTEYTKVFVAHGINFQVQNKLLVK